MMEIMVLNSLCGMVDRRKVLSFISSRNHSRRFLPSQVSSQDSLKEEDGIGNFLAFMKFSRLCRFQVFDVIPTAKKDYIA